ncbi:hypothetical protein PENDEC_c008G00978 [Penicillium decumbens]|uniref:GATA-type domain-containing protein n=1 Tax=Penicillium decumbens TaxID=69771 RepID=A0A1V6PFC4_PENDC|nr:hypothetical protein PENDEC_c008G00978 [Penicillium decumbens]
MPRVSVYNRKGKQINHSTHSITHYFGAQRTEESSDEDASSIHPNVPHASNGPQSKKRRISDDQNPQTLGPGVMENTEVVDRSGANPQTIDTNTGDVSLSETLASNSQALALVDDNVGEIEGTVDGRCGTPEGSTRADDSGIYMDDSNDEDCFDSVYHCNPEDEYLEAEIQALEEDDEFVASIVINDTEDKDDDDDASVVIPNTEDEDDDDDASVVIPDTEDDDDDDNASIPQDGKARVEKAMRLSIKMLKEAAENMDLDDLSSRTPMTRSLAFLLRKNDIDHFLGLYLPGFPREVLVLFEKPTWSFDDLCELPISEVEGKTGIYLIVARCVKGALVGYIGSASNKFGIAGRYKTHKSAAKGDKMPNSLLYSFLRQGNVKWSSRVIACFAPPLPDARYVLLLEGIMAIWFSTLLPPKSDCQFFSLAGSQLSREIRDALDIPSVPHWEALNKAFQLNQGAPRLLPGTRVCPNCGIAEKDVASKFGRWKKAWNAALRGQFVCRTCWRYAWEHQGEVRVPRESKPALVPVKDRVCAMPHCPSTSMASYIAPEEWHVDIRGQYLCSACYRYADRHQGELRVPREPKPAFVPMEDRVCENPNCRATTSPGGHWFIGKQDWDERIRRGYICSNCYQYASKHQGELRVPLPKAAFVPIEDRICANPNCRATSSGNWQIGKDCPEWDKHIRGDYLCNACGNYARKHQGKLRPPPKPQAIVCAICQKPKTLKYRGKSVY